MIAAIWFERQRCWRKASNIFQELDVNEVDLGLALNGLGDVVLLQGNSARAIGLWWEAVQLVQAAGDRYAALWPMRNLVWIALIHGDDGRVLMLLEEHVAWLRDRQENSHLVFVLHLLGMLAGVQGESTRGMALLRESLTLQPHYRSRLIKESLDGFAWLAAHQGQWTRAACLLGATETMFST